MSRICFFILYSLWGCFLPLEAEGKTENRNLRQFYFTEAVPAGPNTVRIPFRLIGRLIVVQAVADGQSGNFALDTGASKVVLNNSYFGGSRTNNRAAAGLTGVLDEVRQTRLQSFTWDALAWSKRTADVVDLSHIENARNIRLLGLIGYDLLEEFEIFIDFYLMQITLSRLDKAGQRLDEEVYLEKISDSLSFELDAHIIALEAEVEGRPLKLGLDSGAEINLLDRRVHRKVLKHFKVIKRVELLGSGGNPVEVLAGKLYRVKLSQVYCSGMRTLLTSLDEINEVYGTRLDGLLGYEFLAPRRTVINYRKQKLYFFSLPGP